MTSCSDCFDLIWKRETSRINDMKEAQQSVCCECSGSILYEFWGCFCHSGRSKVCSQRLTQLVKTSHRHRVQLCSTITQHRATTKYSLNNLIYGGVWMEAVKMIQRKEDEAVRDVSLWELFVHRWRKSVKINTQVEDSLSRSHPDFDRTL